MPYRKPRTSGPRRSGTPVSFDSSAKGKTIIKVIYYFSF